MRDNFLLLKYVWYYKYQTKKSLWYRNKSILISVNFWKLASESALSILFSLDIQISWQKATFLKYGTNSCLFMDSMFDNNGLMYHLFTAVVLMIDSMGYQ